MDIHKTKKKKKKTLDLNGKTKLIDRRNINAHVLIVKYQCKALL